MTFEHVESNEMKEMVSTLLKSKWVVSAALGLLLTGPLGKTLRVIRTR